MSESDFSRFDGVLSPVIVLSPALVPLYANGVAMRTYPMLTSRGPELYFTKKTLLALEEQLSRGQAVTLPPDSNVDGAMVFDPVFSADGTLSYVFLFAADSKPTAEGSLALTGEEFFRAVRSEITEPVYDLLRLTDRLEHSLVRNSDLESGYTLAQIRKRLVRITRFIVNNSDDRIARNNLVVTDFCAILSLCGSVFPLLDLRSEGCCFVPLSRDIAIHLMVSILSSIIFSHVKGSRVIVEIERLSRETLISIRFRCSEEFRALKTEAKDASDGYYFVYRTLSNVGGHMEISSEGKDVCCLKLFFPEVRFSSSEVILGESTFGLSESEDLALRYLRDIAEAR